MPTYKNTKKYFDESYRVKPLILIGLGVLFITIGIYRGEVALVFTKAIRVCLECIGIG